MATVMDTKTGEVLGEIAVGVEPEGVGVSPDSKFTVVTSESTSMAHVIDNAALKLIANVLVDTRPREAKFTPDGKQVWVSSEVGGSVSVIDVAHLEADQEDPLRGAGRAAAAASAGRHGVHQGRQISVRRAWSRQPRRRHRPQDL